LPPWAAIKNLHLIDKITYIPRHHAPHEPIYRPPDNLEGVTKHPQASIHYVKPPHPTDRTFSHPRCLFTDFKWDKETNKTTCSILTHNLCYFVFCLCEPTADSLAFIANFFVFLGTRRIGHGKGRGDTRRAAEMMTLRDGLRTVPAGQRVVLLSQHKGFPTYATNKGVSSSLPFACLLQIEMTSYVSDAQGSISARWYSGQWKAVQNLGILGLEDGTGTSWTTDSNSISSKDLQWLEWKANNTRLEELTPSLSQTPFTARMTPNNAHTPSSFCIGAEHRNMRHYQCAAFQVTTGHSFQADYSTRFRQGADDHLSCPYCGELGTTAYFLTECETLHPERFTILCHMSVKTLTKSTIGACRLISFIHATQLFLRPLQGPPPVPPDPDEPPDPP
jgi:hypothetical protein